MNEIINENDRVAASIVLKFNINKCKSLSFSRGQHDKVTLKLGSETIPALG